MERTVHLAGGDVTTYTFGEAYLCEFDLKSLLAAKHSQPHSVLGMHRAKQGRSEGLVVRALIREAAECWVIDARDPADLMAGGAARWPMTMIAPEGLFEVFIPDQRDFFRYQLRVKRHDGEIRQKADPYSFLPTLGEQDVYLFNEGNEHRIYKKQSAPPLPLLLPLLLISSFNT